MDTLLRYNAMRTCQSTIGSVLATFLGTPDHEVINDIFISYNTWRGKKYFNDIRFLMENWI
ncbi:MAG: hypothetical protein GY861_22365 [bacterium]|nr:hypothetical protein [bacterium]